MGLRAALALALALAAPAGAGTLRVATWSPDLTRDGPGLLLRDIRSGKDDQIAAAVQVIAAADADVLLPFLIPAVVSLASIGFEPLTLTSPQTLIWTMTAWAFLPASLLMRGIAMGRIALMIQEKRARNGALSGAVIPAE